MFAALGALSYAFSLWSSYRAWRWLAYFLFAATAITFLVFIPVSGMFPPALGIGIMLFLLAAGLVYGLAFLRRRRDDLQSRLADDLHGSDAD